MHDANPMLYFGILTKITNQIFQILDPNQPGDDYSLKDIIMMMIEYFWIPTNLIKELVSHQPGCLMLQLPRLKWNTIG